MFAQMRTSGKNFTILRQANKNVKETVCKTLLDYMRHELCIDVNYLEQNFQDQIKRRSSWIYASLGY